jgi:Protein of unknown function (DUF4435)
LLFLADKDFDEYLHREAPGVFKTALYSMENYFCNAEYFEYVLRKFGGPQFSNSKIGELVANFTAHLDTSVKKLIVPMAVLCAIRELDPNADFDGISCMDFIGLNRADISTHRGWRARELGQLTSAKPQCSNVRRYARAFSRDPFNLWLRGKHGLQLIRIILRALQVRHPQCKAGLQKLSAAFGSDALKHAKAYLGEIAGLESYCLG